MQQGYDIGKHYAINRLIILCQKHQNKVLRVNRTGLWRCVKRMADFDC